MAITYNGKTYRNLEDQVQYLTDIAGQGGGKAVEAGYGIDVVSTSTKYTVSVDTDEMATIDYVDESVTGFVTEDEVDDKLEDYRTSALQDAIDAGIVERIEGKCASYVISIQSNPLFNSSDTTVEVPFTTNIIDINGSVIDRTKLKVGDVIYITETDVPDRWFSGNSTPNTRWQILETTKVNILTAGDGINISNNEISVKVGNGIFFDGQDRVSLNNASQAAIAAVATKSTVSVSASGSATDTVQYITVDGVEKKLAGGGGTFEFI